MSWWLKRIFGSPELRRVLRTVISDALGISPTDPTDTVDKRVREAIRDELARCPQRHCANFAASTRANGGSNALDVGL